MIRFGSRVLTSTHKLDMEMPGLSSRLCMVVIHPTAFVTGVGKESITSCVQVSSERSHWLLRQKIPVVIITDRRVPHNCEVPALHRHHGHVLLNLSMEDSDSVVFIARMSPRALSRYFTSTPFLYPCCPPCMSRDTYLGFCWTIYPHMI